MARLGQVGGRVNTQKERGEAETYLRSPGACRVGRRPAAGVESVLHENLLGPLGETGHLGGGGHRAPGVQEGGSP